MCLWQWLNDNSGALQSIAALLVVVLTSLSIGVLWVTWGAVKRGAAASEAQAEAARALTLLAKEQTEVARQQTEAITKQSMAALSSLDATRAANLISEEANTLMAAQIRVDLRPILIFDAVFYPEQNRSRQAIKNVGRGPARDVQISIGTAKDDLPKRYIPARTLIGAGDAAFLAINERMFAESGMTIHYSALDGRRFATVVYMLENAIKHDFEEL